MPPAFTARRLTAKGLGTWRWRLLAFVAGAGVGLGHVPFSALWVALPCLVLVYLLFRHSTDARRAAMVGLLAGTGYFAITLFWIVEPFLVDVARHGWMAPFALVFLAAGLGMLWAIGLGLARRLGGATGLAFMLALGSIEYLRAHLFTGFPWVLIGTIWTETPFAQLAAFVGPHGLTVLTLGGVVLSVEAARGPAMAKLAGVGLMLAAIGGGWALHARIPALQEGAGPVVRVVQPNAAQHLKWDPDWVRVFLNRGLEFTAARGPSEGRPDIIVWPETSVPSLLSRAGPILDQIATAAGGAELVLGIQRRDSTGAFNSLITLDGQGDLDQIYDKHHLVPFGEYMPLGSLVEKWGITPLASRLAPGYTAGPGPRLIQTAAGAALPLICYEAIFPHELNAAQGRADWLLQITNDAWFGKFSGPYQHLAQARMRAIEQGLPMVRAANTGVSAIIDPYGRVLRSIPLDVAGFADAPLPAPLQPTLYSRAGDWPVAGFLLIAFATLLHRRRRIAH